MCVLRFVLVAALVAPFTVRAQQPRQPPTEDSVTIRVVNADLRAAVQVIGQYLDRPVIFTGAPNGTTVTLETPRPIPRRDVSRLLRSLLESQNYEFVDDSAGATYRVRPKPSPQAVLPAPDRASPQVVVQRPASTAPELFVIPLKHAKATDVASTVNALFGRGPIGRRHW